MKLEDIQADYIEYPFMQKNYDKRLKDFSYTSQGEPYQKDIFLALGESGPLHHRMVKKLLTHTNTSQEQIKEVLEDIRVQKYKQIDKEYADKSDNAMWSKIIADERNKFDPEVIFDHFVKFDTLQNMIAGKDDISSREYNRFVEKLTALYNKKGIADTYIKQILKMLPIKRGDLVKIVDAILMSDIQRTDKINIIENIRKGGLFHPVYEAMLEDPSEYDDIIDYVVRYYQTNNDQSSNDFAATQFTESFKSYISSLEQRQGGNIQKD